MTLRGNGTMEVMLDALGEKVVGKCENPVKIGKKCG